MLTCGCARGSTDSINLDDDIDSTGPGGTVPAGTGGANVGGGSGTLAGPGAGGMSSSNGGAGGAMMGTGGMGTGGSIGNGGSMGTGGSLGTGGSIGTGGAGGSGCLPTDVLADGNLEGGPMGGSWTEASSNFMTPICDTGNCGLGGSSGPNAGTYWAWFGGADFFFTPILPEVGTLSQTVMIPSGGDAELEFMLEIPVCDSLFDTLTVSMDAQTIFSRDGADNDCGVLGYKKHTIDVTAYADGNNHTLEFEGINEAFALGPTNFFIDDITLIACQ